MALKIYEPEKEIQSGIFSIELSISYKGLHILITDKNPLIREMGFRGKEDNRICCVPREFLAMLDKGVELREEDICRDLPIYCHPDDTLQNFATVPRKDPYPEHLEETVNSETVNREPDYYTPLEAFSASRKLYGFRNRSADNQFNFRNLIYHFTIPEDEFEEGYNLVQILLDDGSGNMTLLLTQGIQRRNKNTETTSLEMTDQPQPGHSQKTTSTKTKAH